MPPAEHRGGRVETKAAPGPATASTQGDQAANQRRKNAAAPSVATTSGPSPTLLALTRFAWPAAVVAVVAMTFGFFRERSAPQASTSELVAPHVTPVIVHE